MPSLFQMNSLKIWWNKRQSDFEKKYVISLSYYNILMMILILTTILGNCVRIYYNGFIPFILVAFNISWFGLGWGLTPWYMALATTILSGYIGFLICLYVTNVKLIHDGKNPRTAKEYLAIIAITKYIVVNRKGQLSEGSL